MIRGVLLIALVMIAHLTVARGAGAQEPTVLVDGAEPAERGSDFYVSDSLDFRGALRPALGLLTDWSYGSVVLRNGHGDRVQELLTDRIVVRAGGTLVFADRFRVGASLPIALFDNPGDAPVSVYHTPSAPALGDLRLSTSARIAGRFGEAATLALGLRAYLPTGSKSESMSDGTLRVEPQMLFAGRYGAIVYAATLGFQIRPRRADFLGHELGSIVPFSFAAGVNVNDRIVIGPEVFGNTVVEGDQKWFGAHSTPLEILIGGHLRVSDDFTVGSTIGRRLDHADLAPTMRVMALFDYAPDYCIDKDGDSICVPDDACPTLDGPRTNDHHTNGCPVDSDHDGIFDDEDACPRTPGPKDQPPEQRGCPRREPPLPESAPRDEPG